MKPTRQAHPPPTQPHTRKQENNGAQRPKRLEGEQSSIQDDATDDPPPVDIQLVLQQTSNVQ